MMKDSLRAGSRIGAVNAVLVIFLQLIGFLFTAAGLVQKMVTGGGAANLGLLPSAASAAVALGIISVWCGWRAVTDSDEKKMGGALTSGLAEGLTAGVLTAAYAFLVGGLYAQGKDLRMYLSALSPESVKVFLFQLEPMTGAAAVFALQVAGGLLGALLRVIVRSNASKLTAGAELARRLPVGRVLQSTPVLRWIALVVVLGCAVLLPRVWGSYWNYTIGTVGIYILLGLGLNIIVGLSGQLVLGYVAFFAIGAYTFALLTAPQPHQLVLNFWVALGLSILSAALSGMLIGLPIMRLRGDYLAIVTLGFGEIIRILLKSDILTPLTAGPRGVRNIAGPTLMGRSFVGDVDFMYLILAAVFLALFIASRLQNSRVGRAWLSIREDETVSRASGVNTVQYKLLALALGAAFAGLGGALFASRNQFTGPEDHVMMVSINVLCLVIVGGMGSIPGVILGAFVLKGLPEVLRDLDAYRLLAFGALLVIMMIIRPNGLVPAQRPKLEGDLSPTPDSQSPQMQQVEG